MRRYNSLLKNRLGIFVLIIIAVLIVLLIVGSTNKSKLDINSTQLNENSTNKVSLTDNSANLTTQDTDKSELEKVIDKTLEKTDTSDLQTNKLCEEYTLTEGQTIKLADHELKVDRIAEKSVKLTVDDSTIFMSVGSEKIVNNFRITLNAGNIFYFSPNDESNTVILKLGCKTSNENTNEKYVRERGEDICKQVYNECKTSFGLK